MFCYEYKFVLFVALFQMFLLSAPFHIFTYLLHLLHLSPFAYFTFFHVPFSKHILNHNIKFW